MLIRERRNHGLKPFGGHGAVCSEHREKPGARGIRHGKDEVGVWCWGLGLGTLLVCKDSGAGEGGGNGAGSLRRQLECDVTEVTQGTAGQPVQDELTVHQDISR